MKQNRYSTLKIAHFPDKVQSFIDGKITAPIYVRVKPINRCDHSCFFCVYSDGFRPGDRENHIHSGMHTQMRERDVLPRAKMLEVLDDFKTMGVKAVTYSGGGEPLMYPDIVEIMDKTLSLGIDLSIITNGQALAKDRAQVLANAKWVRVSIDYVNAAQMAASRNVPEAAFASVIHNIESFAKIKNKDCELAVNYIIHRDNILGLFGFTKMLKSCGVEHVRFSPMWIPDFEAYHARLAIYVRHQLDRIEELVDANFSVNSTYNIRSSAHSPTRTYHKCHFMQIVPVIGADQVVYACHNKAYDASGAIGSIKDQSFKDLWFSAEAKKVFDELNPAVACKHQCANDAKNLFINDLLSASADNFV